MTSSARCDSAAGYNGDDDEIGCPKDLVGRIGQSGRAIDDDAVVFRRKPGSHLRQAPAFAELVEIAVEVAKRSVCSEHVELRVFGRT